MTGTSVNKRREMNDQCITFNLEDAAGSSKTGLKSFNVSKTKFDSRVEKGL